MRAVDLFAGLGGFTAAAEMAGLEVVWAGNHWRLAVDAHARNHPHVTHECQDLRQADWSKLPTYDILCASPACQGHSQCAQPGRKEDDAVRRRHDIMRATAWAIVDCADVTEPRAILVENVPDFRRWRLYPQWRASLEAIGYHVTETMSVATAHGVPQRRERFFVAAHKRSGFRFRERRAAVEPPFFPCVQWGEGRWNRIADASPNAQARIAKARARGLGYSFLSQHVTGHPGVPLTESIRTITTKDQWIVVRGDRYRPLTLREYARAMAFADDFVLPDAPRADVVKLLGNAVPPPMARDLLMEVCDAAAA